MTNIDRVLRSNLKLSHLQLLVALDEYRHIGQAAKHLSLTQPAVSKIVANIEELFELTLFIRSTRGTEPTAYGETVVRFARSVLADYDRTRDEIAAVASGAAGRVNVGAMVVATPVLLAKAIERLKESSSQTSVMVETGDLKRLLPLLRIGEIDLFIGRLEPGYAAPDLVTIPLYDEPMRIVAPSTHPILKMKEPQWQDLRELPWVVPPLWASSRIKLNQMFYKHGIVPPVDVVESASFVAILSLMQQRQSIGFLANSVAKYFEEQGLIRIVPINVPIELPPVGIMTMQNRVSTPSTKELVACLKAVSDTI